MVLIERSTVNLLLWEMFWVLGEGWREEGREWALNVNAGTVDAGLDLR